MELKGEYGSAIVFSDNLEDGAKSQILDLLNQDFIKDSTVRIMPDVHEGMGCVIGFTADMGDKVIPNIVGVDIGCGMLTVELGDVDIDFQKLDLIISHKIPSGRNVHESRKYKFDKLQELHVFRELNDTRRMERSIGSLGGGNHFIEIGVDSKNHKYLIVHSGSRNLGTQVARLYQNLAIDLCSSLKPHYPKNLCYLTGQYREKYLHDMKICQEYAVFNREIMANIILSNLFKKNLNEFSYFQTIHNYINFKDNIIRKGAISAYEGEKVLIPLNMKDGSILGIGKGNRDWNYSAPHGAGRLLSRTEAKQRLNLDDFKESMKGIYSTSVNKKTLDESPAAYKPIKDIINAITETVDIIDIIKPIYNFKA
ncbi:RNA-splicing ligase RtcB, repairs tRNA damage [Desulfonispora thiosulfatigenes DSM 11270]|uniref:3'-phosphate/5'-hydroxy nucleic acid ligase n=1 Tax=Desulfonispora thiosulfatigenes DSM 11270 TaxID=656914 RepID=A0A1W1VAD4_DESTI|nr:RtcB family protein [Desulfonispora thiosulfatigenes]SMB90173.1 RNA-splicing ligase RtcB, repairs tRNA damage [Desulfonispora thiosulfatigenes DSM 11270]